MAPANLFDPSSGEIYPIGIIFVDVVSVENGVIVLSDVALELLRVGNTFFPRIMAGGNRIVITIQHHSPVRILMQFKFCLLYEFFQYGFIGIRRSLLCRVFAAVISFVVVVVVIPRTRVGRLGGTTVGTTIAVICRTAVAIAVAMIRIGSRIQSHLKTPSSASVGRSIFGIVVYIHGQ